MAVAETHGIQSELIPKIATGFCSGVSRTGGMCGALNGAIMGIGLLAGRDKPGAPVDDVYSQVQTIVTQFRDKFGSINCQELTGCHLGKEEGQIKFRESNQIERCLNYVEVVIRMVLELPRP